MPRNVTSSFTKEDYVKFMKFYQFLMSDPAFVSEHDQEFHEMIDAVVETYDDDKPF